MDNLVEYLTYNAKNNPNHKVSDHLLNYIAQDDELKSKFNDYLNSTLDFTTSKIPQANVSSSSSSTPIVTSIVNPSSKTSSEVSKTETPKTLNKGPIMNTLKHTLIPDTFSLNRVPYKAIPSEILDEMKKQNMTQEEMNYYSKLAFKESSYDPHATVTGTHRDGTSFRALGLFQLTNDKLKDLGITEEEYLDSIPTQVAAVKQLTDSNLRRLEETISEAKKQGYDKWSVAAGAHLGGVNGVRNYFNTKTDLKDKFGTSISKYMNIFKSNIE